MSQNNDYNNSIDSPPRHHETITTSKRHAVTSNIGKEDIRLINITKKIVDYFVRASKQDEHIAKHMKQAIAEAEQSN